MTNAQKKPAPEAKQNFTADVSRLLDIVANALYSNRDVFLRELISNAADACDRLRYDSIQKPDLIADNANLRIHIYKDTDARTLTITDNGVGMTKAELIDHLGTIAKSGTAALMDKMKAKKDEENDPLKLIGQFGVGFYASFMVADTVSVTSRKAGAKTANTWVSDGKTGFEVEKATADQTALLDGERGTAITLHLKDEGSEFLLDEKLKQTIQQYSDHIDVKIFLNNPAETEDGEGDPINSASAIWKRGKSDVTAEQHTEFYRSLSGGFDEPLMTSHWHAEGAFNFSALLYCPLMRPWNLYDPSREGNVKLYVRRVFISDNMPDLMYPWLRFINGVIDSEDLPLNISRENLQHNPILHKIRTAVTKRILKDLAKLVKDDEPGFTTFWGQFGAAIKEGLYDAHAHREDIFKICRFYSTHDNGEAMTSLEQYVERMKDDQDTIYYISGETLDSVKNSPQIEGFKSRGLEVLFMTDTVDEFWLQQVPDFEGKTFKSVTQGDINFDDKKAEGDENDAPEETSEDLTKLIAAIKTTLGDEVSDVRISKRLTDSPVCLVAGEGAPDMHMERVLKIQQNYQGSSKPILEVNAGHSLIKKITTLDSVEDAAYLLLDQALIIQGEPLPNPSEFARRMSEIMQRGL